MRLQSVAFTDEVMRGYHLRTGFCPCPNVPNDSLFETKFVHGFRGYDEIIFKHADGEHCAWQRAPGGNWFPKELMWAQARRRRPR